VASWTFKLGDATYIGISCIILTTLPEFKVVVSISSRTAAASPAAIFVYNPAFPPPVTAYFTPAVVPARLASVNVYEYTPAVGAPTATSKNQAVRLSLAIHINLILFTQLAATHSVPAILTIMFVPALNVEVNPTFVNVVPAAYVVSTTPVEPEFLI
jgi:hypothetical protein